jgi:selenide,water dikinase
VTGEDTTKLTSLASCAGCAGKAGIATLAQVVRPVAALFDASRFPSLIVGIEGPDDAAVYRLSDELALVQTVDFFPPVVDDPYTYGAIAAANAMSDVYAMGGEVLLALNITCFPEDLDPAILAEILRGGAEKVAEAGGVIAGGHTLYDREPKYGLAVSGLAHPERIVRKSGARPGDALVLTKPLGTGLILTAARDGLARQGELDAAVASMLRLNRHASHAALAAGAHAMTDVTGFGLLGHAREVAAASGVRIEIDTRALPELPGATDHARAGITTGGARRNREGLGAAIDIAPGADPARVALAYDPQTSGGLLIALAHDAAGDVVARLREGGDAAYVVGTVVAGEGVLLR